MRSVRVGVALLLYVWAPTVLAQQKFDRVSQSIRDLIDEQRLTGNSGCTASSRQTATRATRTCSKS
jgi:hypothetical protein